MKDITPIDMRCAIGASCPTLIEITPQDMRCDFGPSCPSLHEVEGMVAVIGKISPEVAAILKDRIGEGEDVVLVPKGLLVGIAWGGTDG